MSRRALSEGSHVPIGVRTNLTIWAGLVAITGLEVFLACEEVPQKVMLAMLFGLSLVQASITISYFMHLKFEKVSLVLFIVFSTGFCIVMMTSFFLNEAFF